MNKTCVTGRISNEDLKTYFNNRREISYKELAEYIKIKENKGEKIEYGILTMWE